MIFWPTETSKKIRYFGEIFAVIAAVLVIADSRNKFQLFIAISLGIKVVCVIIEYAINKRNKLKSKLN